MQKRILVTGGAGFIGSHLVDELIKRGSDPGDIIVIDDLSTGKIENVNPDVKVKAVNLCHYSTWELQGLLQKEHIQEVYHLAARARVQPSYLSPHDYILDNVIGTQKLLEACRLAGIKKIVFASSSTVSYGNYLNRDRGEYTGRTIFKDSPYSLSKHMGEELCHMYKNLYDMKIVVLRYFSVYGEKMDLSESNSTVLSRILKTACTDSTFFLYGSGNQSRDFTHVCDIVNGTISAMENSLRLEFDYYELGSTNSVKLNVILKLFPGLRIEKIPAKKEIMHTNANSADAHYGFGYSKSVDVIEWMKDQSNNLDYWKQRLELYEN